MISRTDVYALYALSNFNTLWKQSKLMLQKFILLSFMSDDIVVWNAW